MQRSEVLPVSAVAKPRVYLETSVISYLAAKPIRPAGARWRYEVTGRWWAEQRPHFDVVTSALTRMEAVRGEATGAAERLGLLVAVNVLPVPAELMKLAAQLIAPRAIPPEARLDAVHLAAATLAHCDYLLTWDSRTLGNAAIQRSVRRILEKNGQAPPTIATPEALF